MSSGEDLQQPPSSTLCMTSTAFESPRRREIRTVHLRVTSGGPASESHVGAAASRSVTLGLLPDISECGATGIDDPKAGHGAVRTLRAALVRTDKIMDMKFMTSTEGDAHATTVRPRIVNVHYGDKHALKAVSVEVPPRPVFSISAASANVLPPPPAQTSATCIPGCAPEIRAAI